MDILAAHAKLLQAQKQLEPVLPIRYMANLLHVTPKTIQRLIPLLVQLELAEEIPTGETKKRYRMIEK